MTRFLLFLIAFCNATAQAQNIVPNPSFEEYHDLPNGTAHWFDVVSWHNVNMNAVSSASPDYFHLSGTGGAVLPDNYFGTVWPHTGSGVMGLMTLSLSNDNFREYIGCSLLEPMVPAERYCVSFYWTNGVEPANKRGTNHLGAAFSVNPLEQPSIHVVDYVPQVDNANVLYDHDWILFSDTIIATEAWTDLTIGNFYNDSETDYFTFGNGLNGAYYFIDDVTVKKCSPISLPANALVEQSLNIFPNPAFDNVTITGFTKNASLQIHNAFGQIMKSGSTIFHQAVFDISDLPSGIYTIVCNESTTGLTSQAKLVVLH